MRRGFRGRLCGLPHESRNECGCGILLGLEKADSLDDWIGGQMVEKERMVGRCLATCLSSTGD
jgi:hypothetical protein